MEIVARQSTHELPVRGWTAVHCFDQNLDRHHHPAHGCFHHEVVYHEYLSSKKHYFQTNTPNDLNCHCFSHSVCLHHCFSLFLSQENVSRQNFFASTPSFKLLSYTFKQISFKIHKILRH